jgi:general L-amino acid transport system substrate-binding protein
MKGTKMGLRAIGAAMLAVVMLSGLAVAGPTLDRVRAKGFVQCGVSEGLPGFSNPGASGDWNGIDVDFCRAVAAAVLGDAGKVKYTPLSAKQRFTSLQSGELDILSRNTTWTQSRDSALGLNFAGTVYYDGQGFMVRKKLGVKSARELNGATVCINAGTTTELNAADYFRTHRMQFTPVTFEKSDETVAAYDAGRCDVYSTDQSGLYAQRVKLKAPDDHMILPEIISKEPLGPAVRRDDDQWFNIVRWTLFAMVNAEELDVTSSNVDEMKAKSTNPDVRRLLGAEGEMGKNLGLSNDWAYNVVKRVGNYGEVFERNLGQGSQLKIARGLNQLWNKGGIMYAPPIR